MWGFWSLKSIANSSDWWPHWLEVQSLCGNVAIIWKLQKSWVALCCGHHSWVPEWKRSGSGMQWGETCHGSCDGKDSSECIVRGISLDCNLSVWNPMGKDWSCGETLFKCYKGRVALIGEMPRGTLVLHLVTLMWLCWQISASSEPVAPHHHTPCTSSTFGTHQPLKHHYHSFTPTPEIPGT